MPHWGGGGPGYGASIYPSGFTPPAVPEGYTLQLFEDFLGDSLSALGYTAGSGVNGEGALWSPSHVTVSGSCANLLGYQDTSVEGEYGITSADLAAVDNWVAGQFGIGDGFSTKIGSVNGTRILFAIRSDSLAGLTALGLITGIDTWPPEIDMVEINAPMTLNSATLHYGSGPPTPPGFYPYYQESCNLTDWMVWGIQWNTSTIDLLVQTSPTGSLTTWQSVANPSPSGANSFAQNMYLAFQFQTNDAIYDSGTPNYPVNSPDITAENPVQQQMDWVQICYAS